MPTYEYQCKSCHHRFEIWQKMADEPLSVCPECNGTIRRLLFPAGIVFKGSGFYKTDHGGNAVVGATNQKEPKAAGETTTSKVEGESESKTSKEQASVPAPTSESKVGVKS